MKYIPTSAPSIFKLGILILVTGNLLSSCNCGKNLHTFYYSGDTKVEITVSGDTLGVVLRDTILRPGYSTGKGFDSVNNFIRNYLANQGYKQAMELSDRVALVTSPKKNQGRSALEKDASQLKEKDKDLLINSGYLARVKGSATPLIITNEIIIQFKPGTSDNDINDVFHKYKLAGRKKNPFVPYQYITAIADSSAYDAVKTSQKLHDEPNIKFAQLNFIYIKKYLSEYPNDAFFPRQWDLVNKGLDPAKATEDADIDADLAWNLEKGNKNTVIAVIDDGFDMQHEDLQNNYSVNVRETPGNNEDDDGNSLVDDVVGWDFFDHDNRMEGGYHGTEVAGVAAAEGDNHSGVIGSCPQCGILPLKALTAADDQNAIYYAVQRGAKIINCSWEFPRDIPMPPTFTQAIEFAGTSGVVIIWAMADLHEDFCNPSPPYYPDPTSLANVIAVSSSNSMDMYDNTGYGDCMSILAPSCAIGNMGVLKIATTDEMGDNGRTFGNRDSRDGCTEFLNANYTACFGGTSASAPLVAGVAGLILSANNSLTPQQVTFLLQDCADKIQTSQGHYSSLNGKSTTQTHGYGRLNAYEAVKIASRTEVGGRNGVDIFIRDNDLDWGNTEKSSDYSFEPVRGVIPHDKSPDIKIDAPDPSNHFDTPNNNEGFEAFSDEKPIGSKRNKVYVRVRNRGYRTAANVTVNLYWVYGGAGLPPLWTGFPADPETIDPNWHSLGRQTITSLPYSGSSIAGKRDDPAQIVSFDFPAPDPGLPNNYRLLAMIGCDDDPLVSDANTDLDRVTPAFNNITQTKFEIEANSGAVLWKKYPFTPYTYPTQTNITFIDLPGKIYLPDFIFPHELMLNDKMKRSIHSARSNHFNSFI
jgi:subtilisin family serine protease